MESTWENNYLGSEQWGHMPTPASSCCWASRSLPHPAGLGGQEVADDLTLSVSPIFMIHGGLIFVNVLYQSQPLLAA